MTMHQRRVTKSVASARFVASTTGRLLLASASVVSLPAVLTAGPVCAIQRGHLRHDVSDGATADPGAIACGPNANADGGAASAFGPN